MIERIKPKPPTLEKRIVDCLQNEAAVSHDIERLVAEVHTELAYAQKRAEEAQQWSLDPANSDSEATLQDLRLAEHKLLRLNNSLPLLEQQHRTALSAEYRTNWRTRQQQARLKRDPTSAKLARAEDLIAELVAIYQEVNEVDKLIDAANSDGPAGEDTRLLKCEEHFRNLTEGFTRTLFSVLRETKLYNFRSEQVWPPKQPSMASIFSAPMDGRRFDGDCSDRWWERGAQAAAAKERQDQQALAQAEKARDEFYGRR